MMLFKLCVVFAVLGVSRVHAVEATVAFNAGLDANLQAETGQTIAFNNVLFQFGGGYNNNTGVYTAPKGGVYVFQIHAVTLPNNDFWIELYHNTKYVVSAFARQRSDYDGAGNTAILRLKKDDTVYVKARRTSYFYGRSDEIYATLSGYRIGLLRDGDQ